MTKEKIEAVIDAFVDRWGSDTLIFQGHVTREDLILLICDEYNLEQYKGTKND